MCGNTLNGPSAQSRDVCGPSLPPRSQVLAEPSVTSRARPSVARWSDAASGRRGGWVTEGGGIERNCFDVPQLGHRA